jgi:putative proteasome-type protease
MTYGLGILLPRGLVMAADARSNAGVDQIARVHKLHIIADPGERVIVILSAGNLATSQAVVNLLTETAGHGKPVEDVKAATSMFNVAGIVGVTLRNVLARDRKFVKPYGDPSASFIVGGQIKGEPPRLFEVYEAGNAIEASDRSPFLQIGETKYGKPILDRALTPTSQLDEAAKLALLSFDATIRSNLSVGPPIDLLRYRTDSLTADGLLTLEADNPYWRQLRRDYSEGLAALVTALPPPPAA